MRLPTDMLFQRIKKRTESLAFDSASTEARPVEAFESLAEKYEARVQWMREKGITGSLDRTPDKSRQSAGAVAARLLSSDNSEK